MKKAVARFTLQAVVLASAAFTPAGPAGTLTTAPDNLVVGQPAYVVGAAYTAPVAAIPVDGDGNPHPVPPRPAGQHPAPRPRPAPYAQPVQSPPGKLSDCHIQMQDTNNVVGGKVGTDATSICNGPGSGKQRALLHCNTVNLFGPKRYPDWRATGPWVGRGQPSKAICAASAPKGAGTSAIVEDDVEFGG